MGPSFPNLKMKNWVAVLQRADQRRVLKLQSACLPGQPPHSRVPARTTVTGQAERPQDKQTEPRSTQAWDLSLGVWGVQLLPGRQWLQEECRTWTKLSLNWGRSLKFVARVIKSLLEENVFESLGSCCCCSVTKLCPTLCDPTGCSTPGFSVLHCLLEIAQIRVHWVGDAIWLSHLLLPPFPFALNLFQHQGLFQWVSSLHQMAKVLELQLQHQSFQWIFRVEILKVKKKELGSQFFFYFFLCSCLLCVCMCVYDKKKYIMWDLSS